ncbi:hypothetical protein [Nocardioides insulae]|uniref:hypothetical protein n=1 Tax=Nocardioides insulae TaxID=394734 RepID=UPI000425B269|nr:hypothetical protein [Nocardioides insulae]
MTALAAVPSVVLVGASPHAEAAGRVSVANESGDPVADPDYATTVTVSGSGFQSIQGGHGGIYVFFGMVKDGWRPSQGGQTGQDYLYVPDSESKNNAGYQRFVAFPGSDTAGAANGGTVQADGSWSTRLVIPGATFQSADREGNATTVDCQKVTCGIITIGAHGVVNSSNESFTPVQFEDLRAEGDSNAGDGSGDDSDEGTAAPAQQDDTAATTTRPTPGTTAAPTSTVRRGKPKVTVDRSTAVVGRVLTFTGGGFLPGEQVVASFDDGMAAVGPISAGPSGEVAGVLQLPADTTGGTHLLRLSGAASGAKPTVSFAVLEPAAVSTEQDEERAVWPAYLFLGVSLLALAGATVAVVVRRRRRSTRRKEAARVA